MIKNKIMEERNNQQRDISGSGKMEVKNNNFFQIILGIIFVLVGIFTTYILLQENTFKDPEFYIGFTFIIGGVLAVILWKRTVSIFNKDENKFIYKVKSLFRENRKEHKLTEVKNIIYSENVRFRRTDKGTKRSIDRIAEVEIKNGVRYLLHKTTSSSKIGLLKNKTKEKAEEAASFVGVEIKNESFSPSNVVNKIVDKFKTKK